jgi:G3E family GTPase
VRHFPSSEIGPFGRRQRHARGHRIPVTVTWKAAKTSADCAIIVDTFDENDVTTLPSGCTCCTVRAELQRALRRLLAGREAKPFNRVFIETQQDIGPILRTFVSERALGSEYYVEDARSPDGSRFALADDAPLSWQAFSRFVATLTALRGADLLRAKGLLNIDGCRGPVAVQFMGHLAARPVELQQWPEGERESRQEFVTRGLGSKTVRDLFDAVRAAA